MNGYPDHIASVLGGNKQAFAHLVALFEDMARSVALAQLGDEALAEDAMQEAFLAAYIKLPQLHDHAAFPGWFRTILQRQCSLLRKRQARDLPPNGTPVAELPCDEDDATPRACTRSLNQAMVRSILAGLPGIAREACILRFVHGLRYEDIATLLGVPKGTIKRRIHDARERVMSEFRNRHHKLLRVGYLPISDHLLAMVSHARHDRADFEISLSRFLSWSSLVKALRGGRLDAAFIMAPLAMSLRNKGVPLIYVLDGHHDGSAITVRRDMPEKLLLGARMGLPHAASTQRMFLHGLLGDAPESPPGRPPTQYISPSYLDRYLAGKKIDGFFCAEPWHTKSEVEGRGRILARSGDFAPGHVCCGLAVREEFARENGAILHDYVAELLAAAEFTSSHPDECASIQARYTGISKDIARHILERRFITFQDLPPDRGRLEQALRMALRSAILDKPCDLGSFLHPEYA